MDNQQQTIVQKHRKYVEDRKTISFENVSVKDLKEQIVKSEENIVDAIEEDVKENKTKKDVELPHLKQLLNTFANEQGQQQSNLINIISDFFDNVVDSGFSKNLAKFIPNIEKFGIWYKSAEQESNTRLDKINETFENVIKNASEDQIDVLKMYHKASINQEKKRFDLEVKEMQQQRLEQSLANAEGDMTSELLKKLIPGFGFMHSSLSSISNSAKVWNRFKDEGFWKKIGGYIAFNDKGIGASIGDLILLKLGSGLKGLFAATLILPLKNIFGGLFKNGVKGLGNGLLANASKTKGLAKVGGIFQVGMGLYDAYNIEEQVKNGEITREEANKAQANNAGGTVGGIVGGALGTIFGPLGTIAGSFIGQYVGEWFSNLIYDNWDSITGWFSDAWTSIKSSFTEVGKTASRWWNNSINYVNKLWDDSLQYCKNLGKDIWNGITGVTDKVSTFFSNLGKDIWNGFWDTFDASKKSINDSIDGVVEITGNVWNDVSKFFTGIWDNITGGINSAWTSVTDFVKDPAGSMGIDTEIFGKIFNNISNGISNWWDDKVNILKSGWKSIKSFFGYSDDETKEKMNEITQQTEKLKTSINIEKDKGKDITPTIMKQATGAGLSSVIQQNNVNNVNNQTNVHSTPILSTQQADPNMNLLGSGWLGSSYGVLPV